MIIYYAFTTSGGTFTFENVAAIADPCMSDPSFILKAWYNLHDSLSVVSLPARYDFKWLKNQAAELCRIHFYSANVDELHAQDLSMASAVIQQRNCQCNLPVFWIWHRKNAQYTDCRCIWYGLRFSSVYDTANLQLHGKESK